MMKNKIYQDEVVHIVARNTGFAYGFLNNPR